jgi:hypothetical protein
MFMSIFDVTEINHATSHLNALSFFPCPLQTPYEEQKPNTSETHKKLTSVKKT